MLEEKFILTERGLYWLKVNLANLHGFDKATFEERVAYADEMIAKGLRTFVDTAKSKEQFKMAILDYIAYERNEPIQNIMYLDCTNQAIQLYGLLMSDKDTAKIACLGSGNSRVDAYQMLADGLNSFMGTNIFNRDNCKKSMMITLYGKRKAHYRIIEEMTEEELKTFYINHTEEDLELAFIHTMDTLVPSVMSLMTKIQDLNNKNIDTYNWTMADGFEVKYDVKKPYEFEKSITSSNKMHFTFRITSEEYGGHEYNAGLAPNVIHSSDGYLWRRIKAKLKDLFVTAIHDAYGIHYNFVDDLIEAYKLSLCEMLDDDNFLRNILTQIAGRDVSVPQCKTLIKDDIMNSTYALA